MRESWVELERSYDITLQALGDALDLKDSETEGHSKRVTAFTIAVARVMGIPDDQIRVIARGAFLHDIGKMAVPDAILRKPDVLTPDEVTIMREHCYHGYQMLKRIPFLGEAADIVYSHQEKFDGTGYPRGLKGKRFPWVPEFSRWRIRLMPLPQTVRIARRRVSPPQKVRYRNFPAASLTLRSCGSRSIPDDLWGNLRKQITQT